jgi:hypothetical protein
MKNKQKIENINIKNKIKKTSQKKVLQYMDKVMTKILNSRIKHLYGPKNINYTKQELIVLCLVKNGEQYIKYFIEHYFSLGVRHIVFLDNCSTDKTIKIAKKFKNITILQTDFPFTNNNDMRMRNYLINKFSKNKWSLCVDIDEFFDYPFSNILPLNKFLDYLNKNKYTAVVTQMLDMFPKQIIVGNEPKFNRKQHCYYSINKIKKTPYPANRKCKINNKNIFIFSNGIRKKVFNTDVFLTKHALFLNSLKTKRGHYGHMVNNSNIADISAVLYHYKFTKGFFNSVKDAVKQKHHFLESKEYKAYYSILSKKNKIIFKTKTSKKLSNTNQLINDNFLIVSDFYKSYVKGIDIEKISDNYLKKIIPEYLKGKNCRYQKFIIPSSHRFGSTLLMSLLDSHPKIICYSEIFNIGPPKFDKKYISFENDRFLARLRDIYPLKFLNKCVFCSYNNKFNSIGFKIFYNQLLEDKFQELKKYLSNLNNLKIIHLKRKNLLKAFFSLKLAEKTGNWTIEESRHRKPKKIYIDYENFLNYLKSTEKLENRCLKLFKKNNILKISYEELIKNRKKILSKIQNFLGISHEKLKTNLIKQNPFPLSKSVSNYKQLKQKFKRTKYGKFFEE